MHTKIPFSTFVLAAAIFVGGPAFAQHEHHQPAATTPSAAAAGKLIPVTPKEAAWAENARKNYPVDVCVASGEKLGSMGKSPEYIYRVDGKPDRLVVLCCDGCEEDFKKEPARYLAMLDDAAKSRPPAKKAGGHDAHKSP